MNKNWPRWVKASFSKHFADIFTAGTKTLYCEGDDRDTAKNKNFAEFRMDGPRLREVSKNYWEFFVPVNILVTTSMDDQNVYTHEDLVGFVGSGFTRTIQVFKLGNGPDDSPSTVLLCMELQGDKQNPLRINRFGQVDTTTRLLQSTVEGHYLGHLTEIT
jgi:hypothetical protein